MRSDENSVTVSLGGLSVMIGMPTKGDIPPHTVQSLLRTVRACDARGIPCDLCVVQSGIITKGRDEVVAQFLSGDANRLLWIDADMVWSPESVIKLLAWSTLEPMIGAAYRAKSDTPTYYLNYKGSLSIDSRGLIAVDGAGLGFVMIRREVIQRISDASPEMLDEISGQKLRSIFRTGITQDGYFLGEDMAFFMDLKEIGYTLHLDPAIELGHIGIKQFGGRFSDYIAQQSAA